MSLSKVLSVLAVVALLPAAPVLAGDERINASPADESPITREAPTTPDIGRGPMTGTSGTAEDPSIEGTVASIDHDRGRFVLDTEEGPIDFTTTPSELAGVKVGDFVRVSLVSLESD
jgi:hypothetical protein